MFRCRPWRWIWGLFLLAPLYLFVISQPRETIEEDLTRRAQTALGDAGLSWAVPSFEGRDAVINGTASSEAEREQAHKIVGLVRGVRVVEDRAGLIPLVEPFSWTAKHKEDKIRIKGYVTSERDRASILGIAKAVFPEFTIDDAMTLARGVESREAWMGGVSYSLSVLGHLKRGTVQLSGNKLVVEGDPKDLASYRNVNKMLSEGLPAGLTLSTAKISLPVITPYLWSASLKDNKLALEGFVPTAGIKDELYKLAKETRPDTRVTDKLDFAIGDPKKWAKTLFSIWPSFLKLQSGELKFSGNNLEIVGTAPDKDTADAVLKVFNGGAVSKFKTIVDIDFIAPVEPVLPEINPYQLSAENANGVIKLRGYVPSERAREALVAVVAAVFPDFRVVDELFLGRGGPGEEKWLEYAGFGINQLKGLKFGQFDLVDQNLTLSGEADSGPSFVSILSQMKQGPYDLNLNFRGLKPPLASPFKWSVGLDSGKLILLGNVPDDSARGLLLSLSKKLFPNREIVDQMMLASGAPDSWLTVAQLGLRQLAGLETGRFSMEGLNISLEGLAQGRAVLEQTSKAMQAGLPSGFILDFAVDSDEADDVPVESVEEKPQEIPATVDPQTNSEITSQASTNNDVEDSSTEGSSPVVSPEKQDAEDEKPETPEERAAAEETPEAIPSNVEAAPEPVSKDERAPQVVEETAPEKDSMTVEDKAEAEKTVETAIVPKVVEPAEAPKDASAEKMEKASVDEEVSAKEEETVEEVVPSTPVEADECQQLLDSGLSQGTIQFETNSALLKNDSKPLLNKLARTTKRCEGATIEIAGHTDSDGTERYNKRLSQDRAEAVVSYLVKKGISRRVLKAVGYGEAQPVADNDTDENKAKNRRIEFKVVR